MKQTRVRVNGQARETVPASDRAFHYGDGLFETVRIRNGKPEFLARHLTRLQCGCERLRFPTIPWATLKQEIAEFAFPDSDAVLKIILTRGQGGRGYRYGPDQEATRVLALSPRQPSPAEVLQSGIRATICATRLCTQPALAGIKHLNRLEQVLARAEWDDPDIREGLMLDHSDRLIEGTMSNVFLVCEGKLVTPALTACGIAGIMRSVMLDLAQQLDLASEIRPITLREAETASELFVCNSLIGIWPITTIDGFARYAVGPLTRALADALRNYRDSDDGNWYPR